MHFHGTIVVKPNDIFDIVVHEHRSLGDAPGGFQATLTYGKPMLRKIAMRADAKFTLVDALISLLKETGSLAMTLLTWKWPSKSETELALDIGTEKVNTELIEKGAMVVAQLWAEC